MKMFGRLFVASSGLLMASCASIISGVHQKVSVSTTPVTGATCVLTNNKGQWKVESTPGIAVVHRS